MFSATTKVTWQRLRELVRNRDNNRCYYCGEFSEDGQADHILPISRGGTDDINNLAWSCKSCNSKKSNKIVMEGRIPTVPRDYPLFKPIFFGLMRTIFEWLVPPYPECPNVTYDDNIVMSEFRDRILENWYDEMCILRRQKIREWFRQQVWPEVACAKTFDLLAPSVRGNWHPAQGPRRLPDGNGNLVDVVTLAEMGKYSL